MRIFPFGSWGWGVSLQADRPFATRRIVAPGNRAGKTAATSGDTSGNRKRRPEAEKLAGRRNFLQARGGVWPVMRKIKRPLKRQDQRGGHSVALETGRGRAPVAGRPGVKSGWAVIR